MTLDQKLTHARGMKTQFERSLYEARVHENVALAAHCRKRIDQWAAEIALLEEESSAPPVLDPTKVAEVWGAACGWAN
jgi:hypothetical protein